MDERQKAELLRIAGRQVGFDFPMSQHTTFRVGGNAEAVYEASDPEGLCRVVSFLVNEGIPYLVAGRGSNLLVRDGGIGGVVILLAGAFADIQFEGSDYSDILAGAGLSIVDLLIWCREEGVSGLEFLAGIPGSVGGAVAMNAGAFGKEIGSRVREIRLVSQRGQLTARDRSRLRFSYRDLNLETGAVITNVLFRLDRDPPETVSARIAGCLKRRKETQPLEYPSAGSIFKNPLNDYAGRLIEQAGLKGKRIGGAMISNRHANFIVNKDGATATDILTLINLARDEVRRTAGVQLELEVQIVGGAEES
ncbi:MAG: UDP-N-acetylmuramate dehydrogenase [Desulfobacteraceae bacterium]|jgi:UDP-N-acetylmuramate dehydrogenase|nr:UDP-N-acetylmuramate dehydrogenase [Desulfobacteraceae bacterium]